MKNLIRQERPPGHSHRAPHPAGGQYFFRANAPQGIKEAGHGPGEEDELYDGEDVEGFKQKDLYELQQEAVDEGMSGVDPRYVINRLSSALIRTSTRCINALDVLRALKEGLDQHPSITKEERDRLLNFISIARKEYG